MGAMDELLPRSMLETIQMYLFVLSVLVLNALALPWTLIPTVILLIIFTFLLKWYLNAAQAVKRLESTSRYLVQKYILIYRSVKYNKCDKKGNCCYITNMFNSEKSGVQHDKLNNIWTFNYQKFWFTVQTTAYIRRGPGILSYWKVMLLTDKNIFISLFDNLVCKFILKDNWNNFLKEEYFFFRILIPVHFIHF